MYVCMHNIILACMYVLYVCMYVRRMVYLAFRELEARQERLNLLALSSVTNILTSLKSKETIRIHTYIHT